MEFDKNDGKSEHFYFSKKTCSVYLLALLEKNQRFIKDWMKHHTVIHQTNLFESMEKTGFSFVINQMEIAGCILMKNASESSSRHSAFFI